MGREVRRVPPTWEHPKNAAGHYIPLLGRSWATDLAEWSEGRDQWARGLRRGFGAVPWVPRTGSELDTTYEQWTGREPRKRDYMPDWPESERTHLQMYEDTTEGTPISPVMATPEELARWLADNHASAFGSETATYEQWLATIRAGYAVGAVWTPGEGLRSGVAASTEV